MIAPFVATRNNLVPPRPLKAICTVFCKKATTLSQFLLLWIC